MTSKRRAPRAIARPRKRARYVRRRPMRMMTRQQNTYSFKRFHFQANFNGADALPNYFGAITFKLGDIPNAGEFSSLFDRYKLSGVAYRFVLRKDPAWATTAANKGVFPSIYWVYDYDDDNAPASLNEIQQYPKFMEHYFSESRMSSPWRFFRPAHLNVGFESVTNSYYMPTWKGFIDMASLTVPHYGIKYGVQNLFTGLTLTMETRYYFQCKGVR